MCTHGYSEGVRDNNFNWGVHSRDVGWLTRCLGSSRLTLKSATGQVTPSDPCSCSAVETARGTHSNHVLSFIHNSMYGPIKAMSHYRNLLYMYVSASLKVGFSFTCRQLWYNQPSQYYLTHMYLWGSGGGFWSGPSHSPRSSSLRWGGLFI